MNRMANKPKDTEDDIKKCLIFAESGCGNVVLSFLKKIANMKNIDAEFIKMHKKINPFIEKSLLIKFCKKFNASIFLVGTNSKKRPNNLIFGRIYNNDLLDKYEFGLNNFQPVLTNPNNLLEIGHKPCLFFDGKEFDSDPNFISIKNILIDFFGIKSCQTITPTDLKFCLLFSIDYPTSIHIRCYRSLLKGSEQVNSHLVMIDPKFDLEVRRIECPIPSILKEAYKTPRKIPQDKKVKNISYNDEGAKMGTVHIPLQDLSKIKTYRPKALKRKYAHRTDIQEL